MAGTIFVKMISKMELLHILLVIHWCLTLFVNSETMQCVPAPPTPEYDDQYPSYPSISKNFCILTPELSHGGQLTYLEDCENLRVYSTLPIPAHRNRKYGTHPVVCCPKIKAPI